MNIIVKQTDIDGSSMHGGWRMGNYEGQVIIRSNRQIIKLESRRTRLIAEFIRLQAHIPPPQHAHLVQIILIGHGGGWLAGVGCPSTHRRNKKNPKIDRPGLCRLTERLRFVEYCCSLLSLLLLWYYHYYNIIPMYILENINIIIF